MTLKGSESKVISGKERVEELLAGAEAHTVVTGAGKSVGGDKKESSVQMELTFPPTKSEREQEAVIEAVLFTMGNSVELRQLAVAIGQSQEVARKAVERLMGRYKKSGRGIEITQLEDCYQMCTKSTYYENLIRVAATPKRQVLTEVVLETLSIIAYKQPVTKMEIEKIRGVKSDHAVNRLVEYNLVYEVGRLDAPGRPALFATTEEFLRRFGVGSVGDLPDINPEQEAEIKSQVEEELQLKLEELQAEALGEEEAAAGPEEPGEEEASEASGEEEAAAGSEAPGEEEAEVASEAPGEEMAEVASEAPGGEVAKVVAKTSGQDMEGIALAEAAASGETD